jgi:hypothetical protein
MVVKAVPTEENSIIFDEIAIVPFKYPIIEHAPSAPMVPPVHK